MTETHTPTVAADLRALRRTALELYRLQYANPLTRATMIGALRRIVGTFSDGACDETSFEWEYLTDAVEVLAIRTELVEDYQRATVVRDLSALRQMLRCCWQVGLLDHGRYKRLTDLPRLEPPTRTDRALLTPDQLGQLLAACLRDPNRVKGLRDAAGILVAAATGVRRHELVAIETDALDLDGGYILLATTKGGDPPHRLPGQHRRRPAATVAEPARPTPLRVPAGVPHRARAARPAPEQPPALEGRARTLPAGRAAGHHQHPRPAPVHGQPLAGDPGPVDGLASHRAPAGLDHRQVRPATPGALPPGHRDAPAPRLAPSRSRGTVTLGEVRDPSRLRAGHLGTAPEEGVLSRAGHAGK